MKPENTPTHETPRAPGHLEIDNARLRSAMAEAQTAHEQEIAARDALIGELRAGLLRVNRFLREDVYREAGGDDSPAEPADRLSYDAIGQIREIEALLARTPADAGAELERLRMAEISAIRDGETIVRLREARDAEVTENIALRAQLATADARLAAVLGAADAFMACSPQPLDYWTASERAEFLTALGALESAIKAARTGDAAHPDSVKLAAVIQAARAVIDWAPTAPDHWRDANRKLFADDVKALSLAIDAAKASAGVDVADPLFGLAAEKSRADQLGRNCTWLSARIEEVHAILCPGKHGTWQVRAQQIVDAAKNDVAALLEDKARLATLVKAAQAVIDWSMEPPDDWNFAKRIEYREDVAALDAALRDAKAGARKQPRDPHDLDGESHVRAAASKEGSQ